MKRKENAPAATGNQKPEKNEEQLIREKLIELGHNVINADLNLTHIDSIKKIDAVVATNAILTHGKLDTLKNEGVSVFLLFHSTKSVGTISSKDYSNPMKTIEPTRVLKGIPEETSFFVTNKSYHYFDTTSYFDYNDPTVQIEGGIPNNTNLNPELISQQFSQSRNVYFTFDVSNYRDYGHNIFKRSVKWVLGKEITSPYIVKPNSIVWVTENIAADSTQLSEEEVFLKEKLQSIGKTDITYVPSDLAMLTDLTPAQLGVSNFLSFDSTAPIFGLTYSVVRNNLAFIDCKLVLS